MYTNKRHDLDKGVREPMARMKNPYNIIDVEVPRGKLLKQPDKKTQRNKFINEFPNNVSNNLILNYDSIDQGGSCACSFVGFLNMCRIFESMNKISLIDQNTFKNWEKIWDSFEVCTATDIAMTLDFISEDKRFGKALSLVNYIPLRSAGKGEGVYNHDFWVSKEEIFRRYPFTEQMYDNRKNNVWDEWLFQIGYYIETLIDNKIPVELNSQSHSRTCVGYNDVNILFADNYGNDYSIYFTDMEFCHSGYCIVNKWLVYSTVRDLCFLTLPLKVSDLQEPKKASSPLSKSSRPKPALFDTSIGCSNNTTCPPGNSCQFVNRTTGVGLCKPLKVSPKKAEEEITSLRKIVWKKIRKYHF